MGGTASILFWGTAVRHPQAWSARCSGALVWARLSAAAPARAGGWGRWGVRCAGPAASPPPPRNAVPSGGGEASPRLRWGGGSLLWPQAGGGERGGGGAEGAATPPPRPVGRRPAICCLRRAPPGYTRAVGVARRPGASGAVRSAANGSVRQGGGEGGNLPALVRAPVSPGPASEGAAPFARPGRRRPAVGRQRAGRAGACLGRGAPPPRVQRPLQGRCGDAVSSVCLRPLLGLRGRGGGSGGGPLVPWRRPLTAEGGRHGGPGPGGQPSARGSHSSPAPLYLGSDPRAGPRRGPSSPPPSGRP